MNVETTSQPPPHSAHVRAALDLSTYAEGNASEAWVLMAQLLFVHGKPRFPAIADELGLSAPQAMLLRLLAEPLPMGALAGAMHCDNSNLTWLTDRLEERGLAERRPDPRDRRVKLIAPTEDGIALREELNRRLAEPPEALAALSDEDLDALAAILRKAVAD
jgi:DNA-binding MarR family transcriptional regulator